jgi:allantoinase
MPEYDLLIRGATPVPAIGIGGEVIAGLTAGAAREEIDATGLIVLPGVVDAHVHFNEPGRTEWEGWATGSRAAVAGGVTTVCDMPLNSSPPVVTADAFDAKRRAAEAQSVCDFALWGGLVPGGIDQLEALAWRGVIGFKAFMALSGIDDFPKVDLVTLKAGMRRAAALRLPVAVHAEFDRGLLPPPARSEPDVSAARNGRSESPRTIADYLASRPIEAECEAIRAALDLAAETACALHVVHVSSGRGVSLIAEARAKGVNVTAETCPHYLVFTDEDLERLGAVAKCAPPFREESERTALVAHVREGRVDTIGSDHSPSPWAMKAHDDYFRVWGGIAGVQHLLPILLDTGLDPALVARLTAEQVARRFGLVAKGRIAPGYDADLTLVEIGDAREVTSDSLFYRHRLSPYVGRRLRARVRQTIVRGTTIFKDGRVIAEAGSSGFRARGRLLIPS